MVAIVEEVIGESAARQVGSTSTSGKLPEKTPIARRHNRKKAKDKPKRPVREAILFFFFVSFLSFFSLTTFFILC